MNILFLAPRTPLPADTGGKIRTYNLIRQIAKFCNVHLVCFSFELNDEQYIADFAKANIAVTLVPALKIAVVQKVWKVLANPNPFSVEKYRQTTMSTAIKILLESHRFDLVHVDHIHMAHYIHDLAGLPAVIDEHNVEYKILERCAGVEGSPVNRFLYAQQAKKMKRFEKNMIVTASACTAVSADDAEVLRGLVNRETRIEVLPNGVDTEFFNPAIVLNPPALEEALVFTGSMDWLPNEDAVLYFMKDILPLIWQTKPQLKFYIVGKSPSAAITRMRNEDTRIVITGRVDDVRPFMMRSKVFVTPLRIGGGTRLKILEAMSMKKPVVSTAIGAEGIAHTDDYDIMIADTPSIFAQKTIELLDNQAKSFAIGEMGRQLVLQKYDWGIVGKKLQQIYKDLNHG